MENTILIISNTVTIFFTFIISLTLIVPRIPMKRYVTLSVVLMGGLTLLYMADMFLRGIDAATRIMFFSLSVPSLLYFFLVSKYRNGKVIFAFCFGDMVMLMIGTGCGIASTLCGGNIWVLFWGRLLLAPAAVLLIIKCMRGFYQTVAEEDKSGWWLLAAVSAVFYIILVFAGSNPTPIKDRPADFPLYIAYAVAMALTFVIIFRTIADKQKIIRYEQTEKLLELQLRSFENTIRSLEQNEKRLRIIRHDLRHYENGLRSLVQTGSREEVLEFVNTAADIISIEEPVHYCESAALNSILLFYIGLAREAGCQVETRFQLSSALPATDTELCIVFANAIENAINACRKLSDISERRIRITCIDSPQFVLEVANTYQEGVTLDEAGIPVSKEQNHGYGTQSILAFADKYNALVDYDLNGEWFKLRVLIADPLLS
ncbi:MAG: ATP-binding protein [Butyrivibrio sp.]|nr:ATP-binding protein [Muribaculum sp.]MCM1553509.1 ATP-binding protein [Butyrivibrio sp.]